MEWLRRIVAAILIAETWKWAADDTLGTRQLSGDKVLGKKSISKMTRAIGR
jgi:hypothetical protein